MTGTLSFKNQSFSSDEIELIREVTDSCRGLSRQELAKTVCELLDWRRENGGLKTWECKQLLVRLEAERGVRLPELRVTKPKGTKTSIPTSGSGQWRQPLESTLGRIRPVRLRRVEQGRDHRLWRELVGGYHYLGYRMAFGAQLRYLIEAQEGSRVVGAMGLSSPAWRIAARDEWIGWDDRCRQENLQKIINQSRFFILPWVKIPHLASHVLGQLARRVSEDWQAHFGVRPLLMETLVGEGFRGTSYRAANWHWVGWTQGRGRMARRLRPAHQKLSQDLIRSGAIYADETSWWMGEPGWWLWVLTDPETILYRVEPHRSARIVKDLLGPHFAGTLVSGLPGYLQHPALSPAQMHCSPPEGDLRTQ